MIKLKTELDLNALLKEADSFTYWIDGSKAKMALGPSNFMAQTNLVNHPNLMAAIREISELRKQKPIHLMLNRLPPGITVPEHTDNVKPVEYALERWHLPLVTNEEAFYCQYGKETYFKPGYWWGMIPYWHPHFIKNLGTTERVHLVIDLESSVLKSEISHITAKHFRST